MYYYVEYIQEDKSSPKGMSFFCLEKEDPTEKAKAELNRKLPKGTRYQIKGKPEQIQMPFDKK